MPALYGWTGNPDQSTMIRMDIRKMRQMRDAAEKQVVYNLIDYRRGTTCYMVWGWRAIAIVQIIAA